MHDIPPEKFVHYSSNSILENLAVFCVRSILSMVKCRAG
jgi:hypothetical protein